MTEDQIPKAANFNRIARSYRWLEYFTFGWFLQQTRVCFLARLHDRRHALLFGDGDGRFLVRLLSQNRLLTADVIDTSAAMLNLLSQRAEPFAFGATSGAGSPQFRRLRTHHQSALTYLPELPPDLVITHFFLDCLRQRELDRLIHALTPSLATGALWLISEFRIPPGALAIPARLLTRVLYLGFRLLTGLRVTRLPDYRSPLIQAGFVCIACRHHLFGMLVSELWQSQPSASLTQAQHVR